METNQCITSRRSVRRYEDRPIPRETLERLVELASWAPSWKNTQVSRWTIITDKSLIERIAAEGVMGFEHNMGILRGCAALAVQSLVRSRSGYERDGSFSTTKGSHWESFDAGIAAQTFCLAATDLGLGSCILGVFEEAVVAKLIGLPEDQALASLIPLGFPAESPAAPRRKAVAELARFLD